jgi:hypothetical protein
MPPVFVRLCALIFLLAIGEASSARAADWEAEAMKALATAGENRPAIEAALAQAPADQREGMAFLAANMPESDLRSLSTEFLLENVRLAYEAWREAPWRDQVPLEIFLNDVLPYANIDERRDDWRGDFRKRFAPMIAGIDDPGKAAAAINRQLFGEVKVRYSTDRPKANQSPYESIEAGRASCTGLSILLIDACRSLGIPARFVGTPLWSDGSGNHSWVEVWDGKAWRFTGAAEPTEDRLDEGWFVARAAMAKRDEPRHAIYAVRFEKSPQRFPMVWARRGKDQPQVYAVNVTVRYAKLKLLRRDGESIVRFRTFDKPGGDRVTAEIKLIDEAGKAVAEGATRDERFDSNDHFEAIVRTGERLKVELRAGDETIDAELEPREGEELFTYYLQDGGGEGTANSTAK